MRGIRRRCSHYRIGSGNTPADAGNTDKLCFIGVGGSETPPRMRGIRWWKRNYSKPRRNTPADAGNTGGITSGLNVTRKHPRGCGEYLSKTTVTASAPETPPRMRGIHGIPFQNRAVHGNTPADAGNTPYARIRKSPVRKHPRGCGEYLTRGLAHALECETPPRMRGIRVLRQYRTA